VNDGVALLERVTRPEERVLTMDMVNPFPYAMGKASRLGGGIGSDGISLHIEATAIGHPTHAYFGDADIVMGAQTSRNQRICFTLTFGKLTSPGLRQKIQVGSRNRTGGSCTDVRDCAWQIVGDASQFTTVMVQPPNSGGERTVRPATSSMYG